MLFISPAITANLKTFCFGISACCGVDYRAPRCCPPPQHSPQRSRRRPRSRHAGKPNPSAPSHARDGETPATPRNDAQPPRWEQSPRPASLLAGEGCRGAPHDAETRPSRAGWPRAPRGTGKGDPRVPPRCPRPRAENALGGAVLGAATGTGTPAPLPGPPHRLEPPKAPRRRRSRQRKLRSALLSQPRWLIKALGRINALAGEGSASPDGLLTGGARRPHRDRS